MPDRKILSSKHSLELKKIVLLGKGLECDMWVNGIERTINPHRELYPCVGRYDR